MMIFSRPNRGGIKPAKPPTAARHPERWPTKEIKKMGVKDNTAVMQLFDLLESRYAMRMVWALSDGHPQTFRLLQDSMGGVTPNTLNTRLKQLRAARLVEHGRDGYRLTLQGADLARCMADVQVFANRWAQQQARASAPADQALNGATSIAPAV
jgi:DNA-binding HxlR family transcriptional regulator